MERILDDVVHPGELSVGLVSMTEPLILFAEVVNKQLPPADQQAILHLSTPYSDCFASPNRDFRWYYIVQHQINTINQPPFINPL